MAKSFHHLMLNLRR